MSLYSDYTYHVPYRLPSRATSLSSKSQTSTNTARELGTRRKFLASHSNPGKFSEIQTNDTKYILSSLGEVRHFLSRKPVPSWEDKKSVSFASEDCESINIPAVQKYNNQNETRRSILKTPDITEASEIIYEQPILTREDTLVKIPEYNIKFPNIDKNYWFYGPNGRKLDGLNRPGNQARKIEKLQNLSRKQRKLPGEQTQLEENREEILHKSEEKSEKLSVFTEDVHTSNDLHKEKTHKLHPREITKSAKSSSSSLNEGGSGQHASMPKWFLGSANKLGREGTISLGHLLEETDHVIDSARGGGELNQNLDLDDCEDNQARPQSPAEISPLILYRSATDVDSKEGENLPSINKASILESSLLSLQGKSMMRTDMMRTLPLESDLDKHLKMVRTNKAKNMTFSKYVGPIIPGKYRSGGPIGRPKTVIRPSMATK